MIKRVSLWRAASWVPLLLFAVALSICWDVQVAGESWRFAVFCDTRGSNDLNTWKTCVNTFALTAIADEIVRQQCKLAIVPGDLINGWWANGHTSYEDQFSLWKQLMAPVYDAGIPVYPVRGNHEDGPGAYPPVPPYSTNPDAHLKGAFVDAFGSTNPTNGPAKEVGLTYSFVYENALFIGLDEYVVPHRVSQTWLNAQLAADDSDFVFVYGHEPAYQVVHADCLAAYSINRQLFWNSLGARGNSVYFCGHDHFYDRAHVQDLSGNVVWQVLVGSGGAPPGSPAWSPPHADGSVVGDYHEDSGVGFMIVTVDETKARLDWLWWDSETYKTPTWVIQDSFEIRSVATP